MRYLLSAYAITCAATPWSCTSSAVCAHALVVHFVRYLLVYKCYAMQLWLAQQLVIYRVYIARFEGLA